MDIKTINSWVSRPTGVFLLLLVCALAAYGQALVFPFVHDDFLFIVNNPDIARWNWGGLFLRPENFGARVEDVVAYYRPVTALVNKALYAVWGVSPSGFHAFNIFLHVINAWLVFVWTQETEMVLTGRPARGLAAVFFSLVFLLHPVQVQAVACVSGISTLILTFFCLLALVAVLKLTRASGSHIVFWSIVVLLGFAAAVFSKEQALVLPGIVGWFVFCVKVSGKEIKLGRWIAVMAGMAAGIVTYFFFKRWVIGAETFQSDHLAGGWTRITAIADILLDNIRILLWPTDLHYFRSMDFLAPHATGWLLLSALLVFVLGLVFRLRSWPRFCVMFGFGWFLISQIPTMQIFPLIWEFSWMSTAEHFLYLPSIGWFLMLSGILGACLERMSLRGFRSLVLVIASVTGFWVVVTVIQVRAWSSEIALFERAAAFEPRLGRVQSLLAQAYFQSQRYPEAIESAGTSYRIFKAYEANAVGEKAKAYYRNFRVTSMVTLGLSYLTTNDFDSALTWLSEAARIDPEDPSLQSNLAIVYARRQEWGSAKEHFARALELQPDSVDYLRNYALALSLGGERQKAAEYYGKVLRLRPDDPMANDFLKGQK